MDLPDSWASSETVTLISEESSKLKNTRELISSKYGLDHREIVKKDLSYVAMPEILSAQYCVLSGNSHLLQISPALLAFWTYAISIYDTISDNHLYKNGKPTFLKTYGKESVLIVEKIYKRAIRELSKQLEEEIPRATEIIEEMYNSTIKWDRVRNSHVTSPNEAFLIQENLAGKPAYNIAILSNAEGLGTFSFHLVNAITTLEDLIDLFHGEDFTEKKTTITIAFLIEEFGSLIRDYNLIKKSFAISRTRNYIQDQISSSRRILSGYAPQNRGLLLKFLDDMEQFNRRFPEEYI